MSEVAAADAHHSLFGDFVTISKPRIIPLLVIVAWSAMFVAADGWPGFLPFAAVTVAGIASTAASGAWNHIYEQERDAKMTRTATRPVASGRLSKRTAALFATVMTVIAIAALAPFGLWLAAGLTAAAIAYYVFIYTVWLKPTTPQNIVIGGFAGSFPALIGWAAVTGQVGIPALVIGFIVFLWTPPHFWALALLYKDDYAAADYPMMPSIKGEDHTRRLMLYYAVATVVVSLLLIPFGDASWIYLAAAAVLGYFLIVRCAALATHQTKARYRSYFFYTIQYLGFLCIALMVDRFVPLPPVL